MYETMKKFCKGVDLHDYNKHTGESGEAQGRSVAGSL